MTHIVAVSNQKGGPGKTTLAIELGHWLAARGRRTLVIDTDPQANLTRSLVGRPAPHEITSDGVRADGPANCRRLYGDEDAEGGEPFAVTETLYLMGASRALASAQNLDYEDIVFGFRDRVRSLAESGGFEFVLIDCTPSLSPRLTASYVAADAVLAPTVLGDYSVDAIEELMITVANVRATTNPSLTLLGVVRNMCSRKPELVERLAEDDLAALVPEGGLFDARIHGATLIKRLHALQLSTSTAPENDARTRRVRDEIGAVGAELLARLTRSPSNRPGGGSDEPERAVEVQDTEALPA